MGDPNRTQLATDENFEADLYVAANPGVAAHVARGGLAWSHFDRFGRREGRHQLTPEAAGLIGTRRRRKYDRFRHVLDASRGAGGAFAFAADADAFPVRYGGAAYDLAAYQDESANPGIAHFHEHVRAHRDLLFADLGCGRRSETLDNCLYLEVYPSPSADVVMEPACRYPIADASLDGVGCVSVLEHVGEPWLVAAEIARMVKPGGMIVIDYPFLQPLHGYPSHFFNATREGLRRLFERQFDVVTLQTLGNQTPDHALRWQLSELRSAIGDEDVRTAFDSMSIAALIAEPPGSPFWQRLLATVPDERIAALAAGNTLVGRRRP